MKHNWKKTGSALLAALLLFGSSPSFAAEDVQVLRTKTIDITEDLDLMSQTLYNEAAGDYTRENYFVYQPEGDTLPLICYGNDIAGAASASRVFDIEEDLGNHIVGLTNGSFFVLSTGVSIGPVIKNGQVRTGGYSEEVIAFDENGRVQMGDPSLAVGICIDPIDVEITVEEEEPQEQAAFENENIGSDDDELSEEEPDTDDEEKEEESETHLVTRTEILSFDPIRFEKINFNKTMGKEQGIVVYTSDFGATNESAMETYNLMVAIEEGDTGLGSSLKGTVERVFSSKGKTTLKEGRFLISMAAATPYKTTLSQLKNVQPGSAVEISFSAGEDYMNTQNALGFEAWLVKDGEIAENLNDKERSPRTAAGIKKDGSFVLYTADGRQAGYSAGFTYLELAKRMAELGCVQAVNLDGGASTQLFANLPGEEANAQINRDSLSNDLRRCANYICFVNTKKKTGILDQLRIYPYGEYVLSGASLDLFCLAADENYYPAEVPETLKYKVSSDFGKIDSKGHYTTAGEGTAKVQVVGGGIKGTGTVNIIKSPSSILASINGKPAGTSMTVFPKGMYKLQAAAEYLKLPLASDPACYKWTISKNLGYIDENYILHVQGTPGTKGELTVKAGTTKVVIPVIAADHTQIRELRPLYDLNNIVHNFSSEE